MDDAALVAMWVRASPRTEGDSPGRAASASGSRTQSSSPSAGSGEGDVETWAKPEIWSDYADFVLKLETAKVQAEALKSVTEESAFRPALGKLGNACKSCHTKFRRPKH